LLHFTPTVLTNTSLLYLSYLDAIRRQSDSHFGHSVHEGNVLGVVAGQHTAQTMFVLQRFASPYRDSKGFH
jgi:hypothetical protein